MYQVCLVVANTCFHYNIEVGSIPLSMDIDVLGDLAGCFYSLCNPTRIGVVESLEKDQHAGKRGVARRDVSPGIKDNFRCEVSKL